PDPEPSSGPPEGDSIDGYFEDWARELPALDMTVEGIVERVLALNRYIRRTMDETLAEVGLNFGEWSVLGSLGRPGPPHRRPGAVRSGGIEADGLRALPQAALAELAQVLSALDHGEEVVARELADDAGEARAAVRDEDLRLAGAARVEEDLTRGRVARGVLAA